MLSPAERGRIPLVQESLKRFVVHVLPVNAVISITKEPMTKYQDMLWFLGAGVFVILVHQTLTNEA